MCSLLFKCDWLIELTAANQTIEFITQSSVLDINSEEFPEE